MFVTGPLTHPLGGLIMRDLGKQSFFYIASLIIKAGITKFRRTSWLKKLERMHLHHFMPTCSPARAGARRHLCNAGWVVGVGVNVPLLTRLPRIVQNNKKQNIQKLLINDFETLVFRSFFA